MQSTPKLEIDQGPTGRMLRRQTVVQQAQVTGEQILEEATREEFSRAIEPPIREGGEGKLRPESDFLP